MFGAIFGIVYRSTANRRPGAPRSGCCGLRRVRAGRGAAGVDPRHDASTERKLQLRHDAGLDLVTLATTQLCAGEEIEALWEGFCRI
jgi:hypothetical protein